MIDLIETKEINMTDLDFAKKQIVDEVEIVMNANYDRITPHKNEDEKIIWIIEDWETVREFRKWIKKLVPTLDELVPEKDEEYPTGCLDYFFENWAFQDEYVICSKCNRAVSTENYYKYNDYYFDKNSEEIVCGCCVRENPEEYIESLINNPKVLNTLLDESTLEKFGFELYKKNLRNGWYGVEDNPEAILKEAMEGNDDEFIFNGCYVNPFEVGFEFWRRRK